MAAQQQHSHAQDACQQNFPQGETVFDGPGPVGHIQHHKAEQEAETIGDLVGKMESVPDIVQLPEQEAAHKQQ